MAKISKKGIIILSFIALSVALIAFLPPNISPGIIDEPALEEEFKITTKLNPSDTVTIEENASMNEKTELDFYYDDNGVKHYVLEAVEDLIPEG